MLAQSPDPRPPFARQLPVPQPHGFRRRVRKAHRAHVAGDAFERVAMIAEHIPLRARAGLFQLADALERIAQAFVEEQAEEIVAELTNA